MKKNYRRKNRRKYNQRLQLRTVYVPGWGEHTYVEHEDMPSGGRCCVLRNCYRPRNGKPWGYPDKSLHGWGRLSTFADKHVSSKSIGNDFTNGDRGMAKSVRGAKKFVRTRFRQAEKMAVKRMVRDESYEEV